MVNRGNVEDFQKSLHVLVGKTCWGVVAGRGTANNFSLQLGDRMERDAALTNPYLTEEQRQFDGEFGLFVRCPWVLEGSGGRICSWEDAEDIDDMVRGLQGLVGPPIKRVELTVGLELIVLFEGDLRLQVSPEPADLGEWDNYSFFDRVNAFSVDAEGHVVWAPRFA